LLTLSGAAAQQFVRQKRKKSEVPRFQVVTQPPAHSEKAGLVPPDDTLRKRKLFPEDTGVYVGNLGPSVQKSELQSMFERFGKVRKIIIGKRTGSDDRYAVIFLETAGSVARALEGLYGFRLEDRELQITRFRAANKDSTYMRKRRRSI